MGKQSFRFTERKLQDSGTAGISVRSARLWSCFFSLAFNDMTMLFHRKSDEYAIVEAKKQALNALMNSTDFTWNCSVTSSRINTTPLPHSPPASSGSQSSCVLQAEAVDTRFVFASAHLTTSKLLHYRFEAAKQFGRSPMLFFYCHIWIKIFQIDFFLKPAKVISR
jgi:hypothetical protein